MKITIVTFLLFTASSFAQNIDENNIYYRALKEYARYVDRFEPEVDTVYFEEVKSITTFFPKEVDGLKVIIITALNQAEIYKANGGELIHRKMTPAQVTGGKIDIGLIPYQGRYEPQSGLRLGFSKWHSIIFNFNPVSGKFEYESIQNN